MTIVEFFDDVSINNMASCIAIKPDKIIFIGEKKPMHKQEAAYLRVINACGIDVSFEYRHINRNSVQQIVSVLTEIAENEDCCTFDLTGGEDLVLVAMGIVFEKFRDSGKIQMHRFNVRTGMVFDCDKDGFLPDVEKPMLSVKDNIMLYGGCIVPYDGRKGTYNWIFDAEFAADLKNMWDICKSDPGLWNAQTGTIGFMAEKSRSVGNPLSVSANKSHIEDLMKKRRSKFVWVPGVVHAFYENGFITELDDSADYVSFTFKNEQIKQCLTKEGTLLELMVLLFALSAKEKDGSATFNDAVNGAYIDWDSALHDITDDEKDTENEIDVLLMKGLVPVFISCKNGYVDETELYKLNTVAGKFGGPYAKKVLVATYQGKSTEDGQKYFRQRAEDMQIQLIENVHGLSPEAFAKKIKNLSV